MLDRNTQKKKNNWQNKTDCRDTTTEVLGIINYDSLCFGHRVNKNLRINSAVVHIHCNNWYVRSTTLKWFPFTGITGVTGKSLEWFLFTPITALLEVKLYSGSYSHQTLMCQKHNSRMVPIHRNHWCYRKNSRVVPIHTNHCSVRGKTLEWFLFTSNTDVPEAQL